MPFQRTLLLNLTAFPSTPANAATPDEVARGKLPRLPQLLGR